MRKSISTSISIVLALSITIILSIFLTWEIVHAQNQKSKSSKFKVALLSPGPVSDAGWNAIAYEGLKKIEAELGAQISQVETKTPAEFEEGFRDYASRGYDLVFGHGFEFQDAAKAVAPSFPNTVFITTSGNTVLKNVAPMVFELEQATYLMGVISAMMSKSAKSGLIGGVKIPSIQSTFLAFKAGATSVNPKFQVLESYTGSWEDLGAAKEAATAQINQGADFILHNADAAGLGVFQAVQESNKAGKVVYAFGSNKNQNSVAPEVILASGTIDIPKAFVVMAKKVKDKTFKAEIMRLGMKEGIIDLVYNPKLESKIPKAVKKKVEKLRADILSGKLTVPRGF